jgi:hypothetical protein
MRANRSGRLLGVCLAAAVPLIVVGCGGQTTGATNLTAYTADLHATAHCDKGETCTWYWEYWRADGPRSAGTKTAAAGPVNGPTGSVALTQHIRGLRPDTSYHWAFCGSPSNGKSGSYACVGPSGHPFSTTGDPPPDPGTFTTHAATWTIEPTPNPTGGTNNFLEAVSCTSPMACVAVGSYHDSAGAMVTLAEAWDGTRWTLQTTPNPSGSNAQLTDVSCTAATACAAVGSYQNSAGNIVTLAERWDGQAWSIQPTPNPSGGTRTELRAVSCTASTACTAVGDVVERWDGASWTIQSTPAPAGSTGLNGVSCTSAKACTAVGGGPDALAEHWDGTSWTVQPTPTRNPVDTHLTAVSCTSATACTAVGDDLYSTALLRPRSPIAEHWDGASWSLETMPLPGYQGFPLGVSCASLAACSAVGTYRDAYGSFTGTLIQHRDGGTWTTENAPNPTGVALSGVSCVSETSCTAVGRGVDSTGREITVAEGYAG